MKKSIIGTIITFILVIAATVEIGITLGYYMIINMDYNTFENNYNIEIIK